MFKYLTLKSKRLAILPLLFFIAGLFLIKTGFFAQPTLDNSAQAAAISAAQIAPHAGNKPGNFGDKLAYWNKKRQIKSYFQNDSEKIYDLKDHDIRFLFGAPNLQRKEGTARMIQYQSGQCVMDFYYYDQKNTISYYEIRNLDKAMAVSQSIALCKKRFINAL